MMEERSARRSLLHFFCPTAFPSLVIAVSLVSSSSPAGSSPPMPPPSVVHGVLRVGVGAHVLSSATWEAGERPRWGKSRTPPAALAMCRGRLRLDRVVRTAPALRGSPNAPWESPPLAKRLHTVAVAHRPAVQWNEKAICRPAPRASAASSPEPAPRRTASWPSARRLRILAHLRQASRVTDNPELI